MLRLRLGVGCLLGTVALVAPPALANPSLYQGPGHRPGPDILYRPATRAPQLQNRGIWRADPILVSGASAYRDGEFLYQDYLYDDHGAKAISRDPGDPRVSGDSFSAPNGTYTYPTAPAYADNAADLVELRVKPLANATAFRLTLNTMKKPSLVATTIAIGDLCPASPLSPRRPCEGAGEQVPHRPRLARRPAGRRRPASDRPSAQGERQHGPPSDPGSRPPFVLEPRNPHRSPRRGSRAVGRCQRALSDSRGCRRCPAPGRRRGTRRSDRLLQRRLPVPRAVAAHLPARFGVH